MKKLILLFAFLATACGVKGDPKAPLTPAALGHGQPSFKRATKAITPVPAAEADPQQPPAQPSKNYDRTEQE